MSVLPEVTIVTETFNLAEGQGIEPTRLALNHISALAAGRGDVEIMLADPMESNLLVATLLQQFPAVRHLSAPGAGYEGIKNLAAREARGKFIVYLDSDCVPLSNSWLETLLAPLRQGTATGAAGITEYSDASLLGRVMSILDFGFLIADAGQTVGCYASNNAAFLREARVEVPAPDGPMRCTCYAHTQQLIRAGHPMWRVRDARVVHKLPPVWRERWRRGYDLVAACWINPDLAEARWLRWSLLAAPPLVAANLRHDWRRLGAMQKQWAWSGATLLAARGLSVLLRLIDLGGAFRALALGPDKRWTAYGAAPPAQNRPDPCK